MSQEEPTPVEVAEIPSKLFSVRDWLEWQSLENGIIRIDTMIDSREAADILSRLHYLRQRKVPVVRVYISSPGGNAYSAFAVYDALREMADSGIKVEAVVEGWAASAAAMIVLQAADVRRTQKHARLLLHEVRRWAFFSMERTSDMVDEVEEMKAIEKQIFGILADRCCKDQDEIRKMVERKEIWMSAQQAKDWGLVDEIV